MRKLLFLLLLTLSTASFAARNLPKGKLAELEGFARPEVKLDGKIYTTAPGLQIRGINNTLLMPTQIPRNAMVWYQLEPNTGFVWRIWFVTKEEAQQLEERMKQEEAIEKEIKASQAQ
ncbi:hypothetical protein HQ393_16650 [Chitinibacter bivalviorum]|uniref:Uncharacterized protein n=1 Tax=Chitinibacter bivalviorum TaxID=2739434 RepID=A0A7H9BM93_9NEIS|nr:hypothetical protein [Chitinibacter bivalviorum]QLG89743.1 hypothetical protein HQ393_16650 [Chitinibacter bivalviorum]